MPARLPSSGPLGNEWVTATPTVADDAAELYAALSEPSIWRWMGWLPPRGVEDMRAITEAGVADRERGVRWPWTVRLAADGPLGAGGTVVGTSSYGDVEPAHERIEIGWTVYGLAWQRSFVNTATKLLLMGHAFDDLGYDRLALKTDGLNERSQAAIARIGGVREGVLRHHVRRPDGTTRDTVYFSVLRAEWPAARDRLRSRLAASTPLR